MTIILNGDTGITTPTDAVTGSTSPTNGIYLPTTNAVGFSTNSTERMRIDSSGNVGIGTSSPTTKLNVGGAYPTGYNSTLSQFVGSNVVQANGTGMVSISTNNATGADLGGSLGFGSYDSSISSPYPCAVISGRRESGTAGTYSGYFAVATTLSNGTVAERMRIDSSGRVGIGTSSPNENLTVQQASATTGGPVLSLRNSDASPGNTCGYIRFYSNTTARAELSSVIDSGSPFAGNFIFKTGENTLTERMRIDSSGNLLVGTTATINATTNTFYKNVAEPTLHIVGNYNGNVSPLRIQRYASDGDGIVFFYGTTQKGYVSITSTGTTYNTLSDYRLKENITPMTGALDKVAQLKPVTYTWKENGADGQGFIAHELQDVVPECVSGEKDGIDEKGNPRYQGIDTSFLVATLTKAIQELNAKVESLEAQIKGN